MELQVNGEARTLGDGTTVSQLLQELKVQPERVVVEVNLAILKRAQHITTMLKDGDQVEIVHFVGGGACEVAGDASSVARGRPKEGSPSDRPAAGPVPRVGRAAAGHVPSIDMRRRVVVE